MTVQGKTILVTGATDGVGRHVALTLGAQGATVLVHGRDRGRGEAVVEDIRRRGNGSAAFYAADLSSLAAVRDLAAAITRDHARLDALVNNAAIGTAAGGLHRQLSADGHELRFAVNYLAGFLLTRLLLPTLRASAPARVVNVVSAGQQALDFDDLMFTRAYDGKTAYRKSKLAQVMFTMDLAEELEGSGVTVNAVHPAPYMPTTMVTLGGFEVKSTIEEGARSVIHQVVAAELSAVTGRFFNQLRDAEANAQAYDADARKRLRENSFSLTEEFLRPTRTG